MPDMNVFCQGCGSEIFTVATDSPNVETVNYIICVTCGNKIEVDEVVNFKEVVYLSALPNHGNP